MANKKKTAQNKNAQEIEEVGVEVEIEEIAAPVSEVAPENTPKKSRKKKTEQTKEEAPVQAEQPVAETQATEQSPQAAPAEEASAKEDDIILEVQGLKKYFPIARSLLGKPTAFLRAVDDVSFRLKRGTTIGVVGESGCGKTTLGRTILKLHSSDGGKIIFNGKDITNLSRKKMIPLRTEIQLIFQDPYSSLPPRMTVGNIIAEAVRVHKIVPKDKVNAYVRYIMKKCGLQRQYYDRYPHEFSGGQRQRICIARALAVKPKLVICDEPVSALDVSIQAQIINLLKELQQTMGLTYVFISHDLSVVKYITDQIMVMYLGNVMETGETDELFDHPLHPYTKALFSAVPVPDPDVKMNRIILGGDIPSPANPPAGCKFHTRCPDCMGVCKFLEPKYLEAREGHFVKCHLYDEEVMQNAEALVAEHEQMLREQEALLQEKAEKKQRKRKENKPAPESVSEEQNEEKEN